MNTHSHKSMKPFKLVAIIKKDRTPMNHLLKAAKLIDSPYIVYKQTKLYVDKLPALIQGLDDFDLIVIPKDIYVPN